MVDNGVENVSICSWEAVEERSGLSSSGASSTSNVISSSVLWVPDHAVSRCTHCQTEFWLGRRKHHCRLVDLSLISIVQMSTFSQIVRNNSIFHSSDLVDIYSVLIVQSIGLLYLTNVCLHPSAYALHAIMQCQANVK